MSSAHIGVLHGHPKLVLGSLAAGLGGLALSAATSLAGGTPVSAHHTAAHHADAARVASATTSKAAGTASSVIRPAMARPELSSSAVLAHHGELGSLQTGTPVGSVNPAQPVADPGTTAPSADPGGSSTSVCSASLRFEMADGEGWGLCAGPVSASQAMRTNVAMIDGTAPHWIGVSEPSVALGRAPSVTLPSVGTSGLPAIQQSDRSVTISLGNPQVAIVPAQVDPGNVVTITLPAVTTK